jgi:putative ABC transport system permease protein
MSSIGPISRRLRALFRRSAIEADMSEELRAHLEMQEAANRAAGMSPDEAHYAARRQFGHLDGIKETARDQLGWVWLEALQKDFRFAMRSLAKSPGFTIAVVATLAIGIGATTAIVSYARPIVFPQLPYVQPERMVVVTNSDVTGSQPEAPYPFFSLPYRLAFIRETATSFAALGSCRFDQMNLVVHDDPAAAYVGWVTTDYLTLFGATAEHGRLFVPEEYRSTSGDVALLSRTIWLKRFGADPSIVGQEILLGGKSRRVVGILSMRFSPSYSFSSADIYLPDSPSPTPTVLPFQWLQVVGRLKPGITIEQARAEMSQLHLPVPPRINAAYLESIKPRIVPLAAYYQTDRTYVYWVFLGAVAFLYVIAGSNAVSLMLARTVARRRELGVRLAMGGSRWQIIRLLLTESLVLTTLAGFIGIFIAQWGYWALMTRQSPHTPVPAAQVWALHLPMLITVVAVSVLTSILVVIIPVLRINHTHLSDALKEGAGSLGDSRRLQRLRSGLVVTQAALAVAMLAGAGLMLQSFWRLERVNLGFDPTNKLAVNGMLPDGISQEAFLSLTTRFRDDIARLPAVVDVTYSGILPLANFAASWEIKIDGRPELGGIQFSVNRVSPEYFATLGQPILAGRGFSGIRPSDPPVAIINETAARRYFGSTNPIGQHLDLDQHGKWEIIGVVGDVREWGRRQEIKPQFYYPFWQPPIITSSFIQLVRLATAPPSGLEAMIRRAAYAAEPRLIVNVQHLADNAQQDVQNEQNAMLILEVLSALALVLAATGLFAVMAYAVAQRQREFGVRLALGAAPGDLQWLVLRRGFVLAAAGVVIGLSAAWGLTRFLQSVLYETSPHDPVTYASVAGVLLAVAAAACWLPARRAARVDPMIALRAE